MHMPAWNALKSRLLYPPPHAVSTAGTHSHMRFRSAERPPSGFGAHSHMTAEARAEAFYRSIIFRPMAVRVFSLSGLGLTNSRARAVQAVTQAGLSP